MLLLVRRQANNPGEEGMDKSVLKNAWGTQWGHDSLCPDRQVERHLSKNRGAEQCHSPSPPFSINTEPSVGGRTVAAPLAYTKQDPSHSGRTPLLNQACLQS